MRAQPDFYLHISIVFLTIPEQVLSVVYML